MNHVFIINPVAGSKIVNFKVQKEISNICLENNLDYQLVFTERKSHALSLAKLFAGTDSYVYSVGGDGTLNEVLNGINFENNILGIIPVGTGNDSVRSLYNEKVNIKEMILNNERRNIDVGYVNNRAFINIASIGFDANVCKNVEEIYKKYAIIPNALKYKFSVFTTLLGEKGTIINTENETNKLITLLAVCNGKYYGGGVKISPNSIVDDGAFDILIVDKIQRLKIIKLFLTVPTGKHLETKELDYILNNKLSISSPVSVCCNIDGEIIYDNNFDFTLKHKVLQLKKGK